MVGLRPSDHQDFNPPAALQCTVHARCGILDSGEFSLLREAAKEGARREEEARLRWEGRSWRPQTLSRDHMRSKQAFLPGPGF